MGNDFKPSGGVIVKAFGGFLLGGVLGCANGVYDNAIKGVFGGCVGIARIV